MIEDMAMGLGDPISIAARYGYSSDDYLIMSTQPWFVRMVDDRRESLQAEGFSFTSKMSILAEELLVHTYRAALATESVAQKLDVAKYLSKLSGLEPQPANGNTLSINGGGGAGFSITFNFAGQKPMNVTGENPDMKTIEHTPTSELDELDGIPPLPTPARINEELAYHDDAETEDAGTA